MRDLRYRKVADLGLDCDIWTVRTAVRTTALRNRRATRQRPTPEPLVPGDDVPLSNEEVEVAFRGRSVTSLPWIRQAAAVLDARRAPMTAEEIESFLAGLTTYREKLGPRNGPGMSDLFLTGEDGRLSLNPGAPGLVAMRRAVRGLPQAVLVEREQPTASGTRCVVRRVEPQPDAKARRNAELEEIARMARRAVLRVVPSAEDPQAVAVLDVGQRSIQTFQTFIGRDVAELAGRLERFNVIAGLHIHDTLHALGFNADHRWVVELEPPQKSRWLNCAGRALQITPELLIAGTTRIRRPLGEPEAVARYLLGGDHRRLARQIESDVKALHALYQYGVLHGAVRLRWGSVDEMLATDWALPGDVNLRQQLKSAHEKDAVVDLVVGRAPGWVDPWWQARRVRILDARFPEVVVIKVERGAKVLVATHEIQAIRLAAEDVEPWAWHRIRARNNRNKL
ncbi:hypothetical protein [Sorangium sp. So ce131]|uniref:hypothetical protein n=1 Tax=Sorangium sp. So ce131 TaxID=3133282 RepID=UPI003F5F40B8